MATSAHAFRPHGAKWTPEQVERFWNYESSKSGDLYFARMVGASVVAHVRRKIRLGTVADIGCGAGDLIGHLIASGQEVYGADQSPDSIDVVNTRFRNEPKFKGAFVGTDHLPSVDTVFLLEVVEHLDDAALGAVLKEARRILKPGGHIVITTPNEENRAISTRMCPECGCTFHAMQHVRSWDQTNLCYWMKGSGFIPIACKPTLFLPKRIIPGFIAKPAWKAVKGPLPHLLYIGRKADQRRDAKASHSPPA